MLRYKSLVNGTVKCSENSTYHFDAFSEDFSLISNANVESYVGKTIACNKLVPKTDCVLFLG